MQKEHYRWWLEVYHLTVKEIVKLIQEMYDVPENKFIVQHEPPKVHVDIDNGRNVLLSVELTPLLNGVRLDYESSGYFSKGYLSDFEKAVVELNRSRGREKQPSKAPKPENPKQKRGAQLRTEHSLKRLREIRLIAIENHRSIPKKAAAMNEAGITDKTFREHDPELWARWDDVNYR